MLHRTSDRAATDPSHEFRLALCGEEFLPDVSGALYWVKQETLLVADLHLEKGAAFARRGQMLPPYDTGVTLRRLAEVILRFDPRRVIALGDSFHTSEVAGTLPDAEREALACLQRGRDWQWVTGNHDPDLPVSVGGRVSPAIELAGLTLRHEPSGARGEIAGHLHPMARIARRGAAVRRKCFASDGERLIMPAFGAYAGGLDVLGPAFAGRLLRERLSVWLMGRDRVYPIFGRALGC